MKYILKDADDAVAKWVMERCGGRWVNGRGTAMGLADGSNILAGVVYEGWNKASVMMHVASDGTKRWLNRDFLWLAFAYPFLQLKVNKIIAPVEEGNIDCRRFIEKLGFIDEALISDATPSGYLILYTLQRMNCRWLDLKVPNGKA